MNDMNNTTLSVGDKVELVKQTSHTELIVGTIYTINQLEFNSQIVVESNSKTYVISSSLVRKVS